MKTENPKGTALIFGTAASSGVARGRAFFCRCGETPAVPRRLMDQSKLEKEIGRLGAASHDVEGQLRGLMGEDGQTEGTSEGIFEAQIQMLRDPMFQGDIVNRCLSGMVNIEAAVDDAVKAWLVRFERSKDSTTQERAADLRDIGLRLINRLLEKEESETSRLPEGSILVTHELLPSLAVALSRNRVRGLVVEHGGSNDHAVVLARALGIPMVIRVGEAIQAIRPSDPVIVDGVSGRVFVRPSRAIEGEYDRLEADLEVRRKTMTKLVAQPTETQDHVVIKLAANVGKVADVAAATAFRADGIGLYRTEFAFFAHPRLPTEEEQYRLYRAAVDQISPRELVLRVLDIGSDKQLPYFPLPTEANPSLGLRGTRLLLQHREVLLRPQLRAILRVSATHQVALLFPMISGPDEFIAARRAVASVKAQLRAENQPFDPDIRVGAMIETPAAVFTVRAIAREADFLSVGTNDLVQYLLAADRTSSAMAAYYQPLHPAVVRALKAVMDAVEAEGISVSLCGEIAGDPAYTALLIGLGFRYFSVAARQLLEVKRAISAIRLSDASRSAALALSARSSRGVRFCFTRRPIAKAESDEAEEKHALDQWSSEGGANP